MQELEAESQVHGGLQLHVFVPEFHVIRLELHWHVPLEHVRTPTLTG